MSSWPSFLVIAVVVSLTPGPGTATIIRTAARFGRRTALGTILGHSVGVLMWATLSAVGVSSLIVASQIAYDALKLGGALVLVTMGIRSLIHSRHAGSLGDAEADEASESAGRPARSALAGWRTGVLTGVTNPKLAVFFIALFPQFLSPSAPILLYALLMALVVVAVDVVWFSTLAIAVDRAGTLLRPRVQAWMERFAGAVMVGLGLRLAVE
jgi:threonine/homoserine/homoserine lactone efflux protein